MIYYNREKEIFDDKNMTYLNHGEKADIFYDGEFILKKYLPNLKDAFKIPLEMFETLKTINHSNFIKLYDVYTKEKEFDKENFIIDAFIAKYYKKENINILYEPIDYLIDNFRGLEKLAEVLAENHIVMRDIYCDNVVMNKKQIILIDPDNYYEDILSPKKEILDSNKEELLFLFRDLINVNATNATDAKILRKLNSEFPITYSDGNKVELTYELSKKLKNVKRPIDYFLR